MNVMLLLAQVAPALTDSIAGANPVLTQVNASDEMDYGCPGLDVRTLLLHLVRTQLCYPEGGERRPPVHG